MTLPKSTTGSSHFTIVFLERQTISKEIFPVSAWIVNYDLIS